MIQLLQYTELNLVSAAGECIPTFTLKDIGDTCSSSGSQGYYISIKFDYYDWEMDINCALYCQGKNIGSFNRGMTASCMPGEMAQIKALGGDYAICAGTATYNYS